ncbi:DUF4376 domain-containing protein [Escherichia albertii]|uniref:DUF4376 domain-containing protein n=1 Tax=Escherichia albertii TaxID=208962 RepID=UPI001130555B|nr:DUF4376 domain-containing protein [Escherichia albertii]
MEIRQIKNPRYLASGAIDCEVLFEGMEEFIFYTATAEDTATTGQQIWQELQSGKWGEITPFSTTPEMLEAARTAKRHEIEVWRLEQEAQSFVFEWNGRRWNAGPASLSRLFPVVMSSRSEAARDVMMWGDADNQQIKLTMQDLEALTAAMAVAQTERNTQIYIRQRELKEELEKLNDLSAIKGLYPDY